MKSGGNYYSAKAKRLPRYYRCLRRMLLCGEVKTSSAELAELLGASPSQVRGDLSPFSGAGMKGYGYNVKQLFTEISRELGVGDCMSAVIVGGSSFLREELSERFRGRGVSVVAYIDSSADVKTCNFGGMPCYGFDNIAENLKDSSARLAVIAEIPDGEKINEIASELIAGGIEGIWNMTQEDINASVPIVNLPVGDIISSLCCEVRHAANKNQGGGENEI